MARNSPSKPKPYCFPPVANIQKHAVKVLPEYFWLNSQINSRENTIPLQIGRVSIFHFLCSDMILLYFLISDMFWHRDC